MKAIALLLAILVAAGAAIYYQRTRTAESPREQAALASAQAEAERAAAQARNAEEARKQAEREREKLLKLTKEMGTELDRRNQAAMSNAALAKTGDAESTNNPMAGFGGAMAKMLNDPETRKFIQSQQRMMMDSLYAPLIRQMGLGKEEAARLKDFLADQGMKAAERGMGMLGGQSNAKPREEQIREMAEQQKAIEQETKEFLGEERYAQYQDYQLTLPERMQLNTFRQQTSGGEGSISDAQTEQLLGLIKEEKAAIAPQGAGSMPDSQAGNGMDAMLSNEAAEKLLSAQETLNQRVYARAGGVLDQEQLASFARFQTNQLQTMRMGITMARKMFGSPK